MGSLQNKLLSNLIEQRTGYACSTRLVDQLNGSLPATSLALIDAAEFAMRMQALCVAGLFESLALINADEHLPLELVDRKSTRLNSSHITISYAVFCLKKKK